jgi:hypothetical protein
VIDRFDFRRPEPRSGDQSRPPNQLQAEFERKRSPSSDTAVSKRAAAGQMFDGFRVGGPLERLLGGLVTISDGSTRVSAALEVQGQRRRALAQTSAEPRFLPLADPAVKISSRPGTGGHTSQ